MSDAAFARSSDAAPTTGRPRARDTILYGGLVVGVLDILSAFAFWWLWRDVGPVRILHSVASGLLGAKARDGGATTAALGLLLHFTIAFIVAAVYYAASLKLSTLVRRPVLWGLLYGVAVNFVMSYVVIPLSAIGRASAFAWPSFLFGVIGHALLVGLPPALFAYYSARKNS